MIYASRRDRPTSGDRSKLFQVFSNLLSNAVKFSPPGKIVRIIGRETAREFLFSIEDSGSGLTPSGFKKVFNKFWTGGDGKSSGTGLGLFIAKTIVEAHGGSIGVENLPEGGASFQFRLPKSPQVSQLAFEQLLDADDGRKLILIVDDDEDLREVMVWVLEKEGFHVRSFSSPVRALKELAQMKLKPDLLIVDFHMDELNGNELVRRVRKLPGLEELPVFLITASPLEAEASRGPDLYEEVITKPVDLEGLVKSASKCTNAPSAEQSSI